MTDTWNANKAQAFQFEVSAPLGAASLSMNVIAIVTFYLFKKRRQFPVSLLAWITFFNLWYALNIIIKWSPYSAAHGPETALPISNPVCQFSTFSDQFSLQGGIATNTLVSVMLFLTIVKRKELEYDTNPHYFWIFLGSLVAWECFLPVLNATVGSFSQSSGHCVNSSPFGIYLVFVPAIVQIFVQMCLIITTLIYAAATFKKTRSMVEEGNASRRDSRLYFLCFRLLILWCTQIVAVVPALLNTLFVALGRTIVEDHAKAVDLCHGIGGIVDACIVIFMNPNLIKLFKEKIMNVSHNSSGSDSRDRVSQTPANAGDKSMRESGGSSTGISLKESVSLSMSVNAEQP